LEAEIPSPEFLDQMDKKFGSFTVKKKVETRETKKQSKKRGGDDKKVKIDKNGVESFHPPPFEALEDDGIDISKEFKPPTPAQTARREAAARRIHREAAERAERGGHTPPPRQEEDDD
jgi:hypothetical protein